jgi:ribose transport system substrate-binding protein
MVIGFDAVPAALEAIEEGYMQGTIAQQPFEMGALGVEIAIAKLEGTTVLYDAPLKKELFIEVFLVDDTGTVNKTLIN